MPPPNSPLISVVIPAYNARATVARAIRSALTQTYEPVEVIVGDDGSTDDTLEYVREQFPQVTATTGENGGPNVARNRGAAEARGELLAFCDADDTMAPNRLELQSAALRKLPKPGALCTGIVKIYPRGTVRCDPVYLRGGVVTPSFEDIAYQRCGHMGASVAILRGVFEEHGGFTDTIKEKELYLRLSAAGLTVGRLDLPLYFSYRGSGSLRHNYRGTYGSELEILDRWDPTNASDSPLTEDEHARLCLYWHLEFAGRFVQVRDREMARRCLENARPLAEALDERLPWWTSAVDGPSWGIMARAAALCSGERLRLAVLRSALRQRAARRRMQQLGIPWPQPDESQNSDGDGI